MKAETHLISSRELVVDSARDAEVAWPLNRTPWFQFKVVGSGSTTRAVLARHLYGVATNSGVVAESVCNCRHPITEQGTKKEKRKG